MSPVMPRPLSEWPSVVGRQPLPTPDGYAAARGAAVFTATGALSDSPHVARPTSRRWADVIEELFDLRTLQDDWDGEGTPAPGPALVDGALILAQQLREQRNAPPPDCVHASVNGTVYFEWHEAARYTEYEFVAPDRVVIRSVPRSRAG